MGDAVRAEVVSALTKSLYAAMLDDNFLDVLVDAHRVVVRTRELCTVCHTHCQRPHDPGPSNPPIAKSLEIGPLSRPLTPSTSFQRLPSAGPAASSSKGTDTMLNCLNCPRQISSSCYAKHLSSCMNIGNSRRGAARSTNARTIHDPETGSQYLESGSEVDESKSIAKGKGKAASGDKTTGKGKKRAAEPKAKSVSPKKQKTALLQKPIPLPQAAPPPVVKGTGPPRRPAYVPVNTTNGHPSQPTHAQGHLTPSRPSSAVPPMQVPNTNPNVPSRLRASSVASASSSVSQGSKSMDTRTTRTPTPGLSTGTAASSQTSQGTSQTVIQNGSVHGGHKPAIPIPGINGQLYGAKPMAYPTGNWVVHSGSHVDPPHGDADEVVDSDSSDADSD
ncbi:uncharacterized protein EI90DRAFT_3064246 [Cantharellus anzutake]|uniref:uncharacterized protein n=1 Tax=Cantharellus anzutake TaxID=1750568 RepID=UPI0019075A60|nr:uncharacterized protein EI90DRAFT_3064246 [Cantharellus anzutake]KAF8328684.1 hypothetical protein EI90DRAFT_3064246 [Cantharellus anzutake]